MVYQLDTVYTNSGGVYLEHSDSGWTPIGVSPDSAGVLIRRNSSGKLQELRRSHSTGAQTDSAGLRLLWYPPELGNWVAPEYPGFIPELNRSTPGASWSLPGAPWSPPGAYMEPTWSNMEPRISAGVRRSPPESPGIDYSPLELQAK